MKKIFLIMLASLSIASLYNCSGEDKTTTPTTPPPASKTSFTVKINGLPKNFSKVEIIQEPWEENGVPRIDLHINAVNPNDETEYIQFGIGKGDTGENQIWAFIYVKNGTLYEKGEAGLPNEITINTDNKIVGAFAGGVTANEENLTFTDGVFDITY